MRRKRATPEGRAQANAWYHDWIERPGSRKKKRADGKERYRADPVDHLYRAAKRRAKLTGRKFTIRKSDIVIPRCCPILKKPMVIGTTYAPSLDRRNNSRDYVPGNVNVISKKANRCKTDLTVAEVRRLLKYMEG